MAGLNKNTIIVRVLDDLLAHAKTKRNGNSIQDDVRSAYMPIIRHWIRPSTSKRS